MSANHGPLAQVICDCDQIALLYRSGITLRGWPMHIHMGDPIAGPNDHIYDISQYLRSVEAHF